MRRIVYERAVGSAIFRLIVYTRELRAVHKQMFSSRPAKVNFSTDACV